MQETYQCHLDAIIQFKLLCFLCSMETFYEIMIWKSLHFVFMVIFTFVCFPQFFFKTAKITNEIDSDLKNNILILQNIGRYINNASPKKHIYRMYYKDRSYDSHEDLTGNTALLPAQLNHPPLYAQPRCDCCSKSWASLFSLLVFCHILDSV